MGLLKKLGDGQGFLKAGFLGFQGAGKTYTATLLGIGTRKAFGLTGPVAFVDTENATEYIAPLVKELTGQDLIGLRTRKFEDLLAVGKECVEAGASVLVVDSMTHFWRSLCDAYLAGLNEQRARRNKPPRLSLEFQDWAQVKGQWARWTDFYLNSPLHLIICGRAGFEYDMQRNEETGRNELIKTGIKMKTEAEFGFEPSLLVQMAVDQEPDDKGGFRQIRTATVLKDRFAVIDASVFAFGKRQNHAGELEAVMNSFGPHVRMLKPGAHSTVETKVQPLEVSEEGDLDWARERKTRTILCEEIQGVMVSAIPGQSAEDKRRKADLLATVFGTRSWTAVETMHSEKLREGLRKLMAALDQPKLATMTTPEPLPVAVPTTLAAPPSTEEQDDIPMSYPPTQSQCQPIAPPTKTVPMPRPEPPRASQAPKASLLPVETIEQLQKVVGPHKAAAEDWMRHQGWLVAGQEIERLAPDKAAKVIAKPTQFLRAIGIKEAA